MVGVGGGGSNAVKRMMESEIEGVDFWSLNTDVQVRRGSSCKPGGQQPYTGHAAVLYVIIAEAHYNQVMIAKYHDHEYMNTLL